MRVLWTVFLITGIALVTSACSSSMHENRRTRLSGPADRHYEPVRDNQRERDGRRYVAPHHDAAGGGCMTEPVARRPFPAYVTVARGENLCRIAKRYQTTVQAIVDANRLSSPILPIGTQLRLPSREYYSERPFGGYVRR